MNRADRADLSLDGEGVALDYGQSFLRILYGATRESPPDGDLYDIPGLEDFPRDAIKAFVNAMLNHGRALTQYPVAWASGISLRESFPNISAREVARLIRQHHAAISGAFPEGFVGPKGPIGARLTCIESGLMLRVLRQCRRGWQADLAKTVPALPLHDGLMVPWNRRRHVAEIMWQVLRSGLASRQK
jgi:hypothetical protein